MKHRASARVTANFERNLDSIKLFLDEGGAPARFDELLDLLFDTVLPNVERFPAIGSDFLARRPQSYEGMAQAESLRERLGEGAELREYVAADYLILYAVVQRRVYFLAIRHHRQLSFDLRGHWAR